MIKTRKVLILVMILTIISALVIIMRGKTYTVQIDNLKNNTDAEKFEIEIENNSVVKLIDKKVKNETLKVKFKSLSKGKTFATIKYGGKRYAMFSLYVHNLGIITYNEYMGNSTGAAIIPISIGVLLSYILYLLIKAYKKSQKENIYQYKNIVYLGIIFFHIAAIISVLSIPNNHYGISHTAERLISTFSLSYLLLPVAFIASFFVIISNMLLIKKEGFNLKNMLGLFLGCFICILTMLPETMYNMLYASTWIDIHNEKALGLYIYNFISATVYIIVFYIDCILLGTIIMSIKAAKYIPKFDKDYILILGCKIKKNGSLTNILKGRADRAIEFGKMQKEKTGKDIIYVPSGGKGADEIIPEAEAIKNYLVERGIKKENIITEDKSKNTYENIKFSYEIIGKKASIAFSTTNYHVFRAGIIANKQNINMEGIGAKTKTYFWINAFIREFIATLFQEKKTHIIVVSSIIMLTAIMIGLTYINNIL